MKICVTCVYWTLLFISVSSSALLFIIVASENAQNNYYVSLEKNETLETYDNDTLDNVRVDSEESNIPISHLHDPNTLDINYERSLYEETFTEESNDFEAINSKAQEKENPYKNPAIVAESLTQQPNLSQGISDSEQATVLTLMDTTVAEFQSLAEPKLNPEFSKTRLFLKNSSLLTKNTNIELNVKKEQQENSPSTQEPSLSVIDETTETLNETNSLKEALLLPNSVQDETPELVVVVRAEQAPIVIDELENRHDDEAVNIFPDEVPKVDGTFTTTHELSDVEAKARLVRDNRDEAAAVVLGEGIVTMGSSSPQEDIPSFSEWTQKRLEEAEKKKTHPNASVQNSGTPTRGVGGMKVRSKNYASPDCGAKIVAVNPEARSARSVLASTRDEYMLNTCTSRIWFVVELCEAIQAKKIELANFELFSSSPKDFSVYVSDRFPTRDWSTVGQFTAKDVKDTQSFALQPHLFGKFIKVELQTYYGSEHFCPISLFRAYGTSEFEVLETETENQIAREAHANADDEEDSDEEEGLDAENGEPPRNLFGSARDAVLSIMKKAAEVLVKSSDLTGNNITQIQQSIDSGNILENSFVSCTTPRYTILCDHCSDQTFAKIFQLVSCRERQLNKLLKIDFINRTLRQNGVCKIHGVGVETLATRESKEKSKSTKHSEKHEKYNPDNEKCDVTSNVQLSFLTSILKPEYIAALCNMLAIKERKMVMNTSYEIPFNSKDNNKVDALSKDIEENEASELFQHTLATDTLTSNIDTSSREFKQTVQEMSSEELNKFSSISIEISPNSESVASQIKPTETLGKEETKNDSLIPTLEYSKGSVKEAVQSEVLTTVPIPSLTAQQPILRASEEPSITLGTSIENSPQATTAVPITTINTNDLSNDDTVSDVELLEVVDLSNKIDNIERPDQEGKHGQNENLDQEIKLPTQDTLSFDNILSDLRDLEGEAVHIQNGPAATASATQSITNTSPQKESVFLRLSNRIKALERNMSLSGQYLEELSRRYKKQVEEMQRSLERTVSAMSEESKKRDERESKRAEEIAVLKDEIASLSKSMKNLIYDRDSWRGKIYTIGQHILLICSEVFVIYVILFYCRGNNDKKSDVKEVQSSERDAMRRKSAENFSSHMKKTKKRRPSEIASHITGEYHELMINDKPRETKKEKKKKRKKITSLIGNQAIINYDSERTVIAQGKTVLNVSDNLKVIPKIALSVETLQTDEPQKQTCRRLKSAPENMDWFNDNFPQREHNVQSTLSRSDTFDVESIKSSDLSSLCVANSNDTNSLSTNISLEAIACTEQTAIESRDVLNSKNTSNALKDTRLRVTSSFMKTTLSTRRKKKGYLNEVNGEFNPNSDLTDSKSVQVNPICPRLSPENVYTDDDASSNGLLIGRSDDSRSNSVSSISKHKDKKSTGFKKMVQKKTTQ